MNHTHGVAHTWRVGAHASPQKSAARPCLLPRPRPGARQPGGSQRGVCGPPGPAPATAGARAPHPAPSTEAGRLRPPNLCLRTLRLGSFRTSSELASWLSTVSTPGTFFRGGGDPATGTRRKDSCVVLQESEGPKGGGAVRVSLHGRPSHTPRPAFPFSSGSSSVFRIEACTVCTAGRRGPARLCVP